MSGNPTCTGLTPSSSAFLSLTTPAPNLTGTPAFSLVFAAPLTENGGTIGIAFGTEANCSNATCAAPAAPARGVVAPFGSVTGQSPDAFVRYLSNLNVADSYVNITNTGTLSGNDPAGTLCANVYVFDPNEEPVSCCACPVTPNGLVSLSANNSLVANQLTLTLPSSLVVTVLFTPKPTGGTCNAGALSPAVPDWRAAEQYGR